jgi:hypothetical protein
MAEFKRTVRRLLTCARTHVPSERSSLPIIAIIGAITSRDAATVTGNSAALVLAKDRLTRSASAADQRGDSR